MQKNLIKENKSTSVNINNDFDTIKSGKKAAVGSVLGAKGIFSDLRALPKWFKILLWVGVLVILFFNFFSIQGNWDHGSVGRYFVPVTQYWNVMDGTAFSPFGNTEGAAYAVAVLYSLNGVAAFTGLLAVSMIVYGRPSQFFWGLINAIFYAAFALSVGYVGDFFMNIILIIGALPGWWLVTHMFKVNKLQGHGKKFMVCFWIGTFVVIVFSIFMWMMMIPTAATDIFGTDYTKYDALHILDSLVCGTELVGYAFQLTNIDQQFYIWFFVNVMKILKFTDIAPGTLSINMLLQFVVWFTFSLIGLYERNFKTLIDDFIENHKKQKQLNY